MRNRGRPAAYLPHLSEWLCIRCRVSKPLEQFARDATRLAGRKSLCLACEREKSRAYYAANRETVLARAGGEA